MSAETDFAAAMQPGLAYIYAQDQIPASYVLAIAAVESGWGTATNSDYALEHNPWGLTASCLGYPVLPPSQTGAAVPLVSYPNIYDAAQDFAAFVNPYSGCGNTVYASAWAVRQNGAAWIQALAAAGYAGNSTTWAGDVLAVQPAAYAALVAIGANPVTAALPSGSGGGGSGGPGSTVYIPGASGGPFGSPAADVVGIILVVGLPVTAWLLGTTPRGRAFIRRHFSGPRRMPVGG
jgi:hypothetical protein